MTTTKRKAKKPPGKKRKEGKLVEPKRKMNLSPEERKRRSDAMKKKHEEGVAGGAEFGKLGGRPKKKRASQVIAERASEQGEAMAQVLVDAMDEENPHSIRIKAVEAMTRIEDKEERLALDEAEQLRKMDHDQLVAAVAEKFASNPMVLAIFRQAGESAPTPPPAIEGSAEEIVDAEVVS
jgi:hypothetical protein